MDKKRFHKQEYSLASISILGFFMVLAIPGIWAILYEDDMPFMGVVWIISLIIGYWLVKRVFYYKMFRRTN